MWQLTRSLSRTLRNDTIHTDQSWMLKSEKKIEVSKEKIVEMILGRYCRYQQLQHQATLNT
jgi:hypothetical protein